jgi:hypothetical protein
MRSSRRRLDVRFRVGEEGRAGVAAATWNQKKVVAEAGGGGLTPTVAADVEVRVRGWRGFIDSGCRGG